MCWGFVMQFAFEQRGGAQVVSVPGPRLDAAAADNFKTEICRSIDQGVSSLVLDLSKVEFMDSSGLGAIVACLKHMGSSGSITLAAPTDPVMKVLRLTRMNQVFKVQDGAG